MTSPATASPPTHRGVCTVCRLLVTGTPGEQRYTLDVLSTPDPWSDRLSPPGSPCEHLATDGQLVTVDVVADSVHRLPDVERGTETAWCPQCYRTRVVVERSTEGGDQRPDGEHEWAVTRLDCGHTSSVDLGAVAAAPGVPYAGPGVAVATSTRLRDVAAARGRQEALDHPYGREHDRG